MPIPYQELERDCLTVDASVTVEELRRRLRDATPRPRYVILRLDGGHFGALLVEELARAVEPVLEKLGPAAFDLPLGELPGGLPATGAVQRTALGFGAAERERDHQPKRRLVVLEGDDPVGLLTNEVRGGGIGGLMFDLFGRHVTTDSQAVVAELAAKHDEQTCSRCGARFTFYELRPEINAYACPTCHGVLEAA